MSQWQENPFTPPKSAPSSGADLFPGLRFTEAYSYVFQNANWFLNVLFVTICQFIPIVGPIVTMGYQFDVIEALHRDPHQTYPDFKFDLFVEYLKRGVWPFLVSLVVGLVIGAPAGILFYGTMFAAGLGAAAAGEQAGPIVGILGLGCSVVGFVAVMVLVSVAVVPMYIRAGLAQDFAEAFKFDFVSDFVRKVWKETVLSFLFVMVTGFAAGLVGLALCCVGVYFTMSLVLLAQAHMYYQLYEAYLARGGQAISLKPTTPASPSGPPGPPVLR